METLSMRTKKPQRRDLDWMSIQLLMTAIDLAQAMVIAISEYRMTRNGPRQAAAPAFEHVHTLTAKLEQEAKRARQILEDFAADSTELAS